MTRYPEHLVGLAAEIVQAETLLQDAPAAMAA
jgi:hypothetical protein